MYKLGYDDGTGGNLDAKEEDQDKIREYYRVANGNTGGVGVWGEGGGSIVRGLRLCSYLSDVMLFAAVKAEVRKPRRSDYRGFTEPPKDLPTPKGGGGNGDYSLLYGMNYFNSPESVAAASTDAFVGSDGAMLSLREHVDPSLFVIEPIVSRDVGGLEVWDKLACKWVSADGRGAEVFKGVKEGEDCMVVFVGKAFARAWEERYPGGVKVEATPHRVRQPKVEEIGRPRRAVIYEQKYAEYF